MNFIINIFSSFFTLIGQKFGLSNVLDSTGQIKQTTIIKLSTNYLLNFSQFNNNEYNSILIRHNFVLKKKNKYNFFKKLNSFDINILKEYKIFNNINFYFREILDFESLFLHKSFKATGLTIGKGYAGNIKRNKFKRGPSSHGSKHHRLQGSLGAGTTPGRVFPGKKMSGRLGGKTFFTIKTKINYINKKQKIGFFYGCLPGKNYSYLNFKQLKTP